MQCRPQSAPSAAHTGKRAWAQAPQRRAAQRAARWPPRGEAAAEAPFRQAARGTGPQDRAAVGQLGRRVRLQRQRHGRTQHGCRSRGGSSGPSILKPLVLGAEPLPRPRWRQWRRWQRLARRLLPSQEAPNAACPACQHTQTCISVSACVRACVRCAHGMCPVQVPRAGGVGQYVELDSQLVGREAGQWRGISGGAFGGQRPGGHRLSGHRCSHRPEVVVEEVVPALCLNVYSHSPSVHTHSCVYQSIT